jgi:hypothetical protein
MKKRYTAKDFEPHIIGSGGIISTIAERTGCCWKTARDFCEKTPRLKALLESESETALDLAESVIVNNIKAARRLQEEATAAGGCAIVDSSDARWLLTRKGRSRGYGETSEVSVSVGPVPIPIREIRVHLPADMEDGG